MTRRDTTWGMALALAVLLGGVASARPQGEEAARLSAEPARGFAGPGLPRYRGLDEVVELVAGWSAAGGSRSGALDLGPSSGGRPVPGFEFGSMPAGARPLAERPTVFLIGGLDGRSLAGSEAVLSTTAALLREIDTLPRGLAFVSIPWASPDGLERIRANGNPSGTNDRSSDEDRDGRADEDAPDDLDGDGRILEMLIEDPQGLWTRSSDGRFLAPAREHDSPRYARMREGRDDDGDGSFNEDGPGGVNLDQHFPIGWRGPVQSDTEGGLPLEEPLARRLADLLLERPTALVLMFQGQHGGVAAPGAYERPPWDEELDGHVFRAVTRCFEATTGRAQPELARLRDVRGRLQGGAALDWIYAVPGALAIEVSAWGQGPASEATRALDFAPIGSLRDAPPPPARERGWIDWLDRVRGGIGYLDWYAVELEDGRTALLGGWEPNTYHNPPAEELAGAVEPLVPFVRELVRQMPRLDIRIGSVTREGAFCRVQAQLSNLGALPTALATTGRAHGSRPAACFLELRLPGDARMVAGRERYDMGRLSGEAVSETVEWLVVAPEGSVLELRAGGAWVEEVVREVHP